MIILITRHSNQEVIDDGDERSGGSGHEPQFLSTFYLRVEGQQLGYGQGDEHGGLLALTGEKRNEPCPPAVAAKGTVYRDSLSPRLGEELMRGGVGQGC